MSSNVHETIPIALRDISDGRGSSRTSIRHTTDGADGPADTQLEGDASTVDSVRREDMLGGFDGVGNEDSGPANNAEDITNDPRVMELARRVYDELRMYVPIASGMENQIRRNGLLPKKTLDGDNFIRMTRTRNYYREYVVHLLFFTVL
jgi:hypothetical protein